MLSTSSSDELRGHGPVPPDPPPSLRTNALWIVGANFAYPAFQWGMLIALAKLVSPAQLGQFALGLAIATPVFMFSNVNLRVALATDSRGEYRFEEYVGLRIITTMLALAAICLGTLFLDISPQTRLVVYAVAVSKGVESFSDVFYGYFQRNERIRWMAVSMLLRGAAALLALALIVYKTNSPLWGALGMVAAWAAVFVIHDLPLGAKLNARRRMAVWRPRRQWSLWRLTLPLGIVMMLVALNLNASRYFVEHHLGEEALGIYSAMAYAMVVVTGTGDSLGNAVMPRLSAYFAEGNLAAFRSILFRLVGVAIGLGLAAAATVKLFGTEILHLIYTRTYAAHGDLFLILIVAAGVSCVAWVITHAICAARNFMIQVPMFIVVTLSAMTASAVLVPEKGLIGAGTAVFISTVVHLVLAIGACSYSLWKRAQSDMAPARVARSLVVES